MFEVIDYFVRYYRFLECPIIYFTECEYVYSTIGFLYFVLIPTNYVPSSNVNLFHYIMYR